MPKVSTALRTRRGPARRELSHPNIVAGLLSIVRQRPRALGQPYSLWTLARLADFMAEETGVRVSVETVRRVLKAGGSC